MEMLIGALVGAFVSMVAAVTFYPLTKRLEYLSRRIYRLKPVSVHVERDPSIVWAGFPDWSGASAWLPEIPTGEPPSHSADWYDWARKNNGSDAYLTVFKVTITSREPVSVVVEPPKFRRAEACEGPAMQGVIATRPVGGAAIDVRRIHIDLGTGATMWIDPHGEPKDVLTLILSPGETEQFYMYAQAYSGRHVWSIDLPLLVEGKRMVVPVRDKDGKEFVTYGIEGMAEYLWYGGRWHAREEFDAA
jgi:hypothetical protein